MFDANFEIFTKVFDQMKWCVHCIHGKHNENFQNIQCWARITEWKR